MVNFGLLTAEIISLVWGTPANFNGFRILAALLHGTLVVGVSQTAAFNRGRHLHSAGRPSGWALAHISSFKTESNPKIHSRTWIDNRIKKFFPLNCAALVCSPRWWSQKTSWTISCENDANFLDILTDAAHVTCMIHYSSVPCRSTLLRPTWDLASVQRWLFVLATLYSDNDWNYCS